MKNKLNLQLILSLFYQIIKNKNMQEKIVQELIESGFLDDSDTDIDDNSDNQHIKEKCKFAFVRSTDFQLTSIDSKKGCNRAQELQILPDYYKSLQKRIMYQQKSRLYLQWIISMQAKIIRWRYEYQKRGYSHIHTIVKEDFK